MGLLRWDVAPRYTLGVAPFGLLCFVAGASFVLSDQRRSLRASDSIGAVWGAMAILAVAAINPGNALRVSRNNYDSHPDHTGAAEFVRRYQQGNGEIVIAEDSIVQTYYLGSVDYRLQDVTRAADYSVVRGGVLFDQYTDTPILGSGAELEAVLSHESAKKVYIISTAQVSADLMKRNRGNGIAEVLESSLVEEVFRGRDGETVVWRAGARR